MIAPTWDYLNEARAALSCGAVMNVAELIGALSVAMGEINSGDIVCEGRTDNIRYWLNALKASVDEAEALINQACPPLTMQNEHTAEADERKVA